jgi:hypothetical protein
VVERGAAHIELAYRRALEALPEDNADRLEATHNQAILHLRRGRLAEAEKLARQAVAGLPRAPQVSSHLWCAALGGLGSILNSSNHLSEAEAVLREAAGKAARELGPTHYLTLQEVEVLAQNLAKQGRPGEAEKLLADSLDELGEATGGLGLAAARLEANLADLLFTRREFPRAELLARRCLDTFRKAQGESSLATLSARRALATILWGKGDHASAKDLLRGTLDLFANVPAAENQEAVMLRFSCRQDLGRMLAAENDLGGAEVAFRETLAEAKVRLGEEHPESLRILSGLAYQLVLARKYEEAQGLLEQALALQVKLQGEAHPDAVQTRNSYGFCLFRQGKPAEAEEVFRKQLALVEGNPALGSYSWRTLANLVFVLNQEGKLEEVDRFCGRATRAGYAVLPPGNAELHEIEKLWMASRGRLRGEDAVEELLRELWEEQSQAHGAADGHAQRLLGKLVDYLKSRNKPVEAEKYEALRQEKP